MALRRSPKPGALAAAQRKRAADLVDDERRQRLAFDLLGDDDDRAAALGDALEDRNEVPHARDLLLVQENVRIVELDLASSRGWSRNTARGSRDRTACPRRTSRVGLEALRLFDGDDALFADFVHGLGEEPADRRRRRWPDTVPTWAMRSRSLIGLLWPFTCSTARSTARSMPRFRFIGS